ncbi:CYTH-like domain-containing protein [Myxozyma melibiosi]|uniref:mRNA-capping enzyme subunit beta n=1 Tax=Myxozyma melibiosi TaxID=54550 RepID=A0ABR1F692_9ASCO
MDLKSIINDDSAQKPGQQQPRPQPIINTVPEPAQQQPPIPRRTSSIADLVNKDPVPASPSPLASPVLNNNMLRSAVASQRASPILLTRSLAPVSALSSASSSPAQTHAPQPPPLLSVRSRSMSISSITEDTPPASATARNYSTHSPAGSAFSSPDVQRRDSNRQSNSSATSSPVLPNNGVGDSHNSNSNKHNNNNNNSKHNGKATDNTHKNGDPSRRNKPKRYNSPPIYARKWRSDWKTAYAQHGGESSGNYNSSSTSIANMPSFRSEASASALPGKYSTFTNVEPYEDLTRRVTSWVYANVSEMAAEVQAQIEIEAKVGTILSKETNQRLVLPVDTETLLNTDMLAGQIMFESDMGALQHKAYNAFMNECLRKAEQTQNPITYSHSKTRDTFYSIPQVGYSTRSAPKNERLRISTDVKTEKVVQKCIKTRVRDLMIFCPGSKFDVRISLNIEKPENMDPLPGTKQAIERVKDRVSYVHLNSRIDLTQVVAHNKTTHELEIELDMPDTLSHIRKIKSGQADDSYEEGIRRFLDNVRILVRRGGLDLKEVTL